MSNLDNVQRRLVEGTASWLLFEFHCKRGDLFGEKYLATPVGQILASRFGRKVKAEVNHPVLTNKVVGRPPQVEFAIEENGTLRVVVESKWTGRSTIGLDDILWDLMRLELLAHKFGSECYFVLGGFRKKLLPLLARTHFAGNPANPANAVTLKHKTNVVVPMHRLSGWLATSIKDRMKRHQNVKFPTAIVCEIPHIYPTSGINMTFQVYAWRVRPDKRARRGLVL